MKKITITEHHGMKSLRQGIALSLALSMSTPLFADEPLSPAEHHQQLLAAVADGCPAKYEDIFVEIDNADDLSSIWGGLDDEAAFRARYEVNNSISGAAPSVAEVNAVMGDVAAIHFECNAHRLNLLHQMVTLNTNDATESLEVISGIVDAIDLGSGRWETGDVRTTSRLNPASGWIFLDGRTIGSSLSTADHRGDQYEALFEQINLLNPTNAKSWTNNESIALPDLRGRSIYGSTAMGGAAAPTLNDAAVDASLAGTLGGVFGSDMITLDGNQLPTHTHAMSIVGVHNHDSSAVANHSHTSNNAGSHSHPMNYSGTHDHDLKQGLYAPGNYGPGTYSNRWPTGGLRPSTDGNNSATLTMSVLAAGNHKHVISNAGTHKHTINSAGGHDHSISNSGNHAHSNASAGSSAPVNITGPGVAFNVEMKL